MILTFISHKMIYTNLKTFVANWLRDFNQPLFRDSEKEVNVSVTQNSSRDEIFDILKGVAIFFMIIGHCKPSLLETFIYSFHMPLFFFVTGYFLKIRPLREEIRLSTKRLIFPYIFAAVCICFIATCKDLSNYTWADGSYTQGKIIALLLGFRGDTSLQWMTDNIAALWFIPALFVARCVTIPLIGKIKSTAIACMICLVLGIIGIILEKFFFVPYCIPQGLSAVAFVYVGYLIRKHNFLNLSNMKCLFPFLLILWLYSWNSKGMDIALCRFRSGYVFCLFGSLGAFFALYILVKNFYRSESPFWRIIHFVGRNSLIVYCVHAIELGNINWRAFAILHHISLDHFFLFQIFVHTTIALLFTVIIFKIKPLREGIFQIKRY